MTPTELEQLRIETNQKASQRTWILLGLTLGIGAIILAIFPTGGTVYILFFFISIAFIFIWQSKFKTQKKFMIIAKKEFITGAYTETFGDCTFDPDGVSEEEVQQSYAVNMGNQFSSNDLVTFHYKGVEVRRADVWTQEYTESDHGNSTVTYFKGPFYVIEYPKKVEGYVFIYEHDSTFRRSNPGGLFKGIKKQERVNFESVEFNKRWTCYATDPEEAFYIMNPHMMEVVDRFEEQYPGRLAFTFHEGKMYVSIYNDQDELEVNMYAPIAEETIQAYKASTQALKTMLDDLEIEKA